MSQINPRGLSFPVPTTTWLPREWHRPVVEMLTRYDLEEHDNRRTKPLKSGALTDIYIKVRNARSHPAALTMLTELYAHPLRLLNPTRFVEVPDAVSCIAGPLSQLTNIPYLTIRGEAKEGRVADSKVVGDFNFGDEVVIIDDVITNGDSKIVPYRECIRRGLKVRAVIVLVDRQQGWREDFRKCGIDVPVWAGMTLHDVRRELIAMGAMERCNPSVEERNPFVVALDGKKWDEILPLIDRLRPTGCILKVNDLLFNEGVKYLLPELSIYGRLMVDPKGHDIPSTVENIMKHLHPCPPWAVTVHASGGKAMVMAAKEALKGTLTKVLAVTVLTYMDDENCDSVYHQLPMAQVKTLAHLANEAGADGFVCSPKEVMMLRQIYPKALLVVPGIRSPGADVNDQKRVDTPKNTMDAGANYLVIGRQFTTAPDPVAEVYRVAAEELQRPLLA